MARGSLALFAVLLLVVVHVHVAANSVPSPTPWPLTFRAMCVVTYNGALSINDLWYDWPNGRNVILITQQLGNTVHDVEWNNGTSFYYDLDSQSCERYQFDVGVLSPDWLVANSTYLGQYTVDNFTCNAWSKADNFIIYYEDVETQLPVRWVFYTGRTVDILTFEVGSTLAETQWQAPAYCFDTENSEQTTEVRMLTATTQEPLVRWHYMMETPLPRTFLPNV